MIIGRSDLEAGENASQYWSRKETVADRRHRAQTPTFEAAVQHTKTETDETLPDTPSKHERPKTSAIDGEASFKEPDPSANPEIRSLGSSET
ncbi:unnamed protein product [Boreogadus saida]